MVAGIEEASRDLIAELLQLTNQKIDDRKLDEPEEDIGVFYVATYGSKKR